MHIGAIHAPKNVDGESPIGVFSIPKEVLRNIVIDAPEKRDDSVVGSLIHQLRARFREGCGRG
jgi:hypothetical protein